MKRALFRFLIFTVWCASVIAAEPIAFVGEWSVDFDRTMEEAKQSPKYTPETAERMPELIKRAVQTMRFRVTPTDVVYVIRGKEVAYSYSVVKSDPGSAVLSVKIKEQEHTLTLRLVDAAWLNFKSSGSDDMDYYVWKREPAGG